jgi:hypothetical protein
MTTDCNESGMARLGAAGSATIMHQGYIIELADGGPWLKNDLTWTPIWDERGVWHEVIDAELAMARSLSPNVRDERPGEQPKTL